MPGINVNTNTIALPSEVSSKIIAKLQEGSAVMQLAQSIELSGLGTTMPIITSDPEAEWVEETNENQLRDQVLTQRQ